MNDFHLILQKLKTRNPPPPLYPTNVWDTEMSAQIQNLTQLPVVVRSGLLLWNDDLDASHTLSQNLHDATGSYWHAIMHRREGDAGNSKYWWRRTGAHPVFGVVQQAALAVLESETNPDAQKFAAELRHAMTWLPERFVDACTSGPNDSSWLLRVQAAEIETLLSWCVEQA